MKQETSYKVSSRIGHLLCSNLIGQNVTTMVQSFIWYDQLAAHSSGGGSDDQGRGKESL